MLLVNVESFAHLTITGWCFSEDFGADLISIECNNHLLEASCFRHERLDVADVHKLKNPIVGFSLKIPPECWDFASDDICNFHLIINDVKQLDYPIILVRQALASEIDHFLSAPDMTSADRELLLSHLIKSNCVESLTEEMRSKFDLLDAIVNQPPPPLEIAPEVVVDQHEPGVSPLGSTLEYHLDLFDNFVLVGWAFDCTNLGNEIFSVVCNDLQLNRHVVRIERSDVVSVKDISFLRTGFEITIPGYIWETTSSDSCLLDVYINDIKVTQNSILIEKKDVVAFLNKMETVPDGLIELKSVMVLFEHLKYSGLLSNLNGIQRKFVDKYAEKFNLVSFLFDDESSIPVETKRIDSIDINNVVLWRVLAAFNQGVTSRNVDPYSLYQKLVNDYRLSRSMRIRLSLVLTPYFCSVKKFGLLYQHIEMQTISELTDSMNAWELSLVLPMLVLSEQVSTAVVVYRKLIDCSGPSWINTECIVATQEFAIAAFRCGEINYSQLNGLCNCLLDFVDHFKGEYWSRLHDQNIIESVICLVRNMDIFERDLNQLIADLILRNYALCPSFWMHLKHDRALLEGASPALFEANFRSNRFFELLYSGEFTTPDGWLEAFEILSHFMLLMNVDAQHYMRELSVYLLPKITNCSDFFRYRSYLTIVSTSNQSDIIRFAALPGANTGLSVYYSNAVRSAMSPLISVPRKEHNLFLFPIIIKINKLLAIHACGKPITLPGDLMEDISRLCCTRMEYLGFELLAIIFSVSDPCTQSGLMAEIHSVFQVAIEKSVLSNVIYAPILTGLARIVRYCSVKEDVLAESFLLHAHGEVERKFGAQYNYIWESSSKLPPLQNRDELVSDTLVVIYTCQKYLNVRVPAIRDTWLKALVSKGIPYLIVVGNGNGTIEQDILSLSVSDAYEDLPEKSLALMKWFVKETNYQFIFKIDDDCFLDADKFFNDFVYRKHHYYGRVINRRLGGTDRTWHQSKSQSIRGKKSLDMSPEPSRYADGGGGYCLSRFAAMSVVSQSLSSKGATICSVSFMEDKLIGDLLALSHIYPNNEDYDVSIKRRTHSEAIPVGIYDNYFMPGASSTTKLVHLDNSDDMATTWGRLNDPELWPKKIWPTYTVPTMGYDSNQLELISSRDKLKLIDLGGAIVISVVRNEMVMLPHFLEHYRSLGIRVFVMADNLSDDGTREYLFKQPDVVLYSVDTQYKHSHFGVAWQQAILSNHCFGKWVVLVDADEFLIYPEYERCDIFSFISDIEKRGANAVSTLMIDMYPKSDLDNADFSNSSPFDSACYFDKNPLIEWALGSGCFSNSLTKLSALRHRLAPDSAPNMFTSQKVALFRYFPWLRISEGVHYVANTNVASEHCYLGHFKYHSGFKKKAMTEVRRKQHFNNAAEYEKYQSMMAEAGGIFWSETESAHYLDSRSIFSECNMPRPSNE